MDAKLCDHATRDPDTNLKASWPVRLWLAAPDWLFRVLGAAVFLVVIVWVRIPAYWRDFWLSGVYIRARGWYVPWGNVLIDLTYLLIALGFIFRVAPKWRASRPLEIVLPLIAAFWPFLPFAAQFLLNQFAPTLGRALAAFMFEFRSPARFVAGTSLIILGNAIDVWGYSKLFRSISIVPEARELKVTGPYRFVRHPIYFGQMVAQAGVWLFYARLHVIWIAFYACFVLMQLYRSRLEDRVLERAFGEPYLAWKRRTFWFV